MEHWAEIRRLHLSEGISIKGITRRLGLARNTVQAADAPRSSRPRRGSAVDGFEPAIRRASVGAQAATDLLPEFHHPPEHCPGWCSITTSGSSR